MKILFGFDFNAQKLTINFVKTKAENIDVKIPTLKVTAKPFMGPEP